MKKIMAIMITVFLTAPAFAGPKDDLQKAVQAILGILNSRQPLSVKRKKITVIYNKNFDARGLAVSTLKRDWKYTLTKEEDRKQFTDKYSRFILLFYLSKIDKFRNNKVVFLNEKIKSGGKKAVVHTLMEYNNKMAKVDYSMVKRGSQWKVYDVEIEGIRISSTYRNQFAGILKKKGTQGLLNTLDSMIAKYR